MSRKNDLRDKLDKVDAFLPGNGQPLDGTAAEGQAGAREILPRANRGRLHMSLNDMPASSAKEGPGPEAQERDKAAGSEVAALQERLNRWVGAVPSMLLDTALIEDGPFPNRIEESFTGPAWKEFVETIATTKGNVQPVLVRRKAGDAERYEMVFGRRRTRACRELGLQVKAVVDDDMSDLALWEAMLFENSGRADPSPYEQGLSYDMALKAGLYLNKSDLAEAVGRSLSLVSRYVSIAQLPKEVLDAFPAKTAIQKHWGDTLGKALQNDPDHITKVAREIAEQKGQYNAKQVFDMLTNRDGAVARTMEVRSSTGRVLAVVVQKSPHEFSVRGKKGFKIDSKVVDRVVELLENQRDSKLL